LLLIATFGTWVTASQGLLSASTSGFSHINWGWWTLVLSLVAAAVAAVLLAVRTAPRALWIVAAAAGGLALLLALYGVVHPVGLLDTQGADTVSYDISAGWGLFLAVLASLGIITTAVLAGRRKA